MIQVILIALALAGASLLVRHILQTATSEDATVREELVDKLKLLNRRIAGVEFNGAHLRILNLAYHHGEPALLVQEPMGCYALFFKDGDVIELGRDRAMDHLRLTFGSDIIVH